MVFEVIVTATRKLRVNKDMEGLQPEPFISK